jgi:hypothetical protein
VDGAWQPQGTCSNDPDECVDGATEQGDRCAACQGGRWEAVDCPCAADDLSAPCNGCPAGTTPGARRSPATALAVGAVVSPPPTSFGRRAGSTTIPVPATPASASASPGRESLEPLSP